MIGLMTLINVVIKSCILAFVAPVASEVSELDMYGLLSTEVILPLSMLIQPGQSKQKQRRRLKRSHVSKKFGLLAISRVIDLVGPVLPFAGGIDLRKLHPFELYEWIKSCVLCQDSSFQGALARSRSSSGMVSSLNATYSSQLKLQGALIEKEGRKYTADKNRPLVLGGADPFVSLDEIGELNLEEVALAFQLSRTSQDTTASNISSSRKEMQHLIIAMQQAAASGRGEGVQPASSANANGDIDASLFCAALRIFAEWRMLRTVPDGYKSYSVGMALGLKDVVQNIAKVEVVIREWIEVKSMQLATEDILRGPTVRQLLEYECEINLHPNLPRLNGGAAIGLLWSLRQLLYQSAVFQNILDTPKKFEDTKTAVGAAYTQVYGKYHGWAVQKIFNYSFRSAPDASLIYNMMDIGKLREITGGASRGGSIVLSCDEESFATDDTEISESFDADDDASYDVAGQFVADLAFWGAAVNTTKSEGLAHEVESLKVDLDNKNNDWLGNLMHHASNIVEHIDREFSKIGEKLLESQRLLANWGDMKALDDKTGVAETKENIHFLVVDEQTNSTCNSAASSSGTTLDGPELEIYIAQKMEEHIRIQISHYLNLMKPITFDLGELFQELNMNDPSKV